MAYMIGFVLLVFVLGLYHVITGDDIRDNKDNPIVAKGYLSDEEYLNNGGVIRYHWYGKTRE